MACLLWFVATLAGPSSMTASERSGDLEHDEPALHDDCAVVISRRSADADGWKQVASAVRTFHRDSGVTTHVFEESPLELKDALAAVHPRHLILVAAPEELNRSVFLDLHRLCRGLDDDPGLISSGGFSPDEAGNPPCVRSSRVSL